MSDFDAAAPSFDRHRAFPAGVPEAIRSAVWAAAGEPENGRLLDLGAGSGRLGCAFAEAGDRYVGVDASSAMLREFCRRGPGACVVAADGGALPFPAGTFDVVLLAHVLSGARGWRSLLQDACRVLRPDGAVVVGQTAAPESGVDARMKDRLAAILETLGVPPESPRRRRGSALDWLREASSRASTAIAAEWTAERSPRRFLDRHRTGSRFSALPREIQEESYRQLAAWARDEFSSLDAISRELHRFELQIFTLRDSR